MTKALLLLGTGISLFAQADPVPIPGQKFQPSHIDVRFASVESLPAQVRVYKAEPQHFVPSVISNVMVLCGFTQKDRQAPPPQERGTIIFAIKQPGSHFVIIRPAQGWITYSDSSAKASDIRRQLENVPNDNEITGLTYQCLAALGVDSSQVAVKPKYKTVGHRGRKDSLGQKKDEEVISRGLFLPRRLDGIDTVGGEGLSIEFGNDAKIVGFEFVWRNLRPDKLCDVATTNQMIDWIKSGKAVTPVEIEGLDEVKMLTVTGIKLRYLTQAGGEAEQTVWPVAEITATAEISGTKKDITLYCPVISDAK